MRRRDQVVETEQRVLLGGLFLEHVKGGTGHLAAFKRCLEVRFDDQATAGAVHDAHAILHLLDRSRVDDVARGVGQRRVQGDDVGALEQLVQFHLLDAHFLGPLRRQERVIAHHLHAQAQRPIAHDGADIAAADDAQRLGGQLDTHELGLFPLAFMGGRVGLRDLAGQRHHHRDGVLGRGDGIAERRVHHDHALGGRSRDIDIVDTDTGAADDLEVVRLLQHIRRHLGGGADGEAVILADDGQKFVLVEARLEVHVETTVLENLHGGGR